LEPLNILISLILIVDANVVGIKTGAIIIIGREVDPGAGGFVEIVAPKRGRWLLKTV